MIHDGIISKLLSHHFGFSYSVPELACFFALLAEHEIAQDNALCPGLLPLRIEDRLIFLELPPEKTFPLIKKFIERGILIRVEAENFRGYNMPLGDEFLSIVDAAKLRRRSRAKARERRQRIKEEADV